jgi:hypothetical protein
VVWASSSFYLVDSQTPGATYKVLWYHPHGEGSNKRRGAVKVDILLPGTMDLPALNRSRIDFSNHRQLPTAPLSLVLLHKLRGWSDRIRSTKTYYYRRHPKDALDVAQLLPIAASSSVNITDPVLPCKLVKKARRWVNLYVKIYPEYDTTKEWKEIGFHPQKTYPKQVLRFLTS